MLLDPFSIMTTGLFKVRAEISYLSYLSDPARVLAFHAVGELSAKPRTAYLGGNGLNSDPLKWWATSNAASDHQCKKSLPSIRLLVNYGYLKLNRS
jgi:hypothetical protein